MLTPGIPFRRALALAVSAGVVLVAPAGASAFTLPANAGSAPGSDPTTYCQAFPSDSDQAAMPDPATDQALDVLCLDAAAAANQAHADSVAVATELAAVDSDVEQLHTDLTSGGGTSTAQSVSLTGPVQLSDGDRQLEADIGSQTDMDLYVIVGVILAVFVGAELLRMWRS